MGVAAATPIVNYPQELSVILLAPVTLDHGTPTMAVKIQGTERILIVNSGSCCNLLQPGVADVPLESTFELFDVTEDSLDIVGEEQILFQMRSHLQSFIFGLQIANICG
jgi:hypothetical protein